MRFFTTQRGRILWGLSSILMKVPKACKMLYSNLMKQFHLKISKISSLKLIEYHVGIWCQYFTFRLGKNQFKSVFLNLSLQRNLPQMFALETFAMIQVSVLLLLITQMSRNMASLFYFYVSAEPLAATPRTLRFNGTPVEKHWLKYIRNGIYCSCFKQTRHLCLFIRLFASQAEAVEWKLRKVWKPSACACCLESASS